jgi:protein Tex
MRRGEQEGYLRVSIEPEEEKVLEALLRAVRPWIYGSVASGRKCRQRFIQKAPCYPSIENEFKALHKEKADEEAIRVFAENLRQLLLSSPLGQKSVLALDPGFRSGCKLVCLDRQGNLLHNETIYPHAPQNEKSIAAKENQHTRGIV